MLKIEAVTVDARDPARLAGFWAELLGGTVHTDSVEEVWIDIPNSTLEILFLANQDPRKVKNRLHFDLRPTDQAEAVARAIDLGAKHIDIGQDSSATWVVLADPEGNEFCILRALSAE